MGSGVESFSSTPNNDSNNPNKQGTTSSQGTSSMSNKPAINGEWLQNGPLETPPASGDLSSGCQPYIAAYTTAKATDVKASTIPFDSDSGSESGVELSFEPEDDISTLGCSVTNVPMPLGEEPDGYKSDDIYSTPAAPERLSSSLTKPRHKEEVRSSRKARKKRNKNASSRKENVLALAPVEEQSTDIESQSTPKISPTSANPKQTIEEIMNRVVKGNSESHITLKKSKSSKQNQSSWHGEQEHGVHQTARAFSQSVRENSNSSDIDGSATIDLSDVASDDVVQRTLKGRSFFSEDHTVGELDQVYES